MIVAGNFETTYVVHSFRIDYKMIISLKITDHENFFCDSE